MNKGMALYVFAFVLLIVTAITFANADPITPAVVEARAETSAGPVMVDVINEASAALLKLIAGASIASALVFAWTMGGKIYRRWWSDNLKRRWKPGPNAMYQQQNPKMPKLTREDLILLALGNRAPGGRVDLGRLPRARQQEDENEIEIDL